MRPISRAHLDAMRALLRDAPLDPSIRNEILAALPEPTRGKGRPQENKYLAQLVVMQLLIERGADPKPALLGLLPRNATERDRNRVLKAYQRFAKKKIRIKPLNKKIGASLERIMKWYAAEHLKPRTKTRQRRT